MTCSRSPCTFSPRGIGRSSHSGPLQGVVTLGTIGQMALVVSGHHCQHYSGSGHSRGTVWTGSRDDLTPARRLRTTFPGRLPAPLTLSVVRLLNLQPRQRAPALVER